MKNTALLERPIHTEIDLHQYWLELMNPLGFTQRRLYFVFLDHERRVVPQIHEISGIPARPDQEFLDSLLQVFAHFSHSFTFALLLTRPGDHPMDSDDRAWARGLIDAGQRADIPLEPIHLATDTSLAPFTGDDLLG